MFYRKYFLSNFQNKKFQTHWRICGNKYASEIFYQCVWFFFLIQWKIRLWKLTKYPGIASRIFGEVTSVFNFEPWQWSSNQKASSCIQDSIGVYFTTVHAHPCAWKPRTRPKPDQIFWNLPLDAVDKIARSARESARALLSIWNLNSHENLDAFWLLDHYLSSKSKEIGFMWIWCIFKKFQFFKFFKFEIFSAFWRDIIEAFVIRLCQWVFKIWQWPSSKNHLFLSKSI